MTIREPDPTAESTTSVVESVFEQTPLILMAMEGPELRIVVWNALAEQILAPLVGGLGASVWDEPWLRGTGAHDALRRVLDSGEPFTAHASRLALPGAAGQAQEVYLDLTYTPWRRPDDTLRGIIATGTDVTETTRKRLAAEAESRLWQEQFETSRDAMIALQSALLPPTVPVIPGLQIGARYLLAESNAAAGGDWFSAYPTTQGRVGLVVGDVVGHGVAASAAMGQLRAVFKERLRSGAPLSTTLQALDGYAATLPDADAATVCAVVIDPASGEAEYCTAGHPPPLVVDATGWRYLEPTGAGPLGSGRGFATANTRVSADGLLLLYSDGLIERPGVDRAASVIEIAEVVADALSGSPSVRGAPAHAPDRVCEQSLELLTRITGFADDITMLAVHRVDPPAILSAQLHAEPSAVSTAIAQLERWLGGVDAGQTDQLHLRHAIVEVVTNSLEHGLPGRTDGVIDVTARLTDSGEAVIDIADNGRWKEPAAAPAAQATGRLRGLGLPLAGQLVHDLTVRHDDTGTHVRLRRRLSRPAPMVTTALMTPGRPSPPSLDGELTIDSDPDRPDTLHVHGPVLSTTAERLRTRLDIESRAGTRTLTVNLDDVTHLASAGVRILQQADRIARRQDNQLILTAHPGSAAHDILRLLGSPLVDERPV